MSKKTNKQREEDFQDMIIEDLEYELINRLSVDEVEEEHSKQKQRDDLSEKEAKEKMEDAEEDYSRFDDNHKSFGRQKNIFG